MKLKLIPQDFVVNEIYDMEIFKEKKENRAKPYYYFKLIKTNYSQLDAVDKVAKIFGTSRKLVHFAGTKDKVGVTSQVISVYGVNVNTFEENLEFFNSLKDLHLEYLGQFDGRVNLGDNKGNEFVITLRDLSDDEVLKIKDKFPNIEKNGVFNFFDSQRFGYANNSHIVGRYVLQNEIEKAVYEIMTSLPTNNPSDDLICFVDEVKKNWDDVKNCDRVVVEKLIEIAPGFLRSEVKMLEHLGKHKNDFPGAFRRIHKKLRTLYVNAYQSYLFNETINEIKKKENGEELFEKIKELELVWQKVDLSGDELIEKIVLDLLERYKLSLESFELKHMPELRFSSVLRVVKNYPKNMKLGDFCDDELNEGMKKVEIFFELFSGEYATNVVKQLF